MKHSVVTYITTVVVDFIANISFVIAYYNSVPEEVTVFLMRLSIAADIITFLILIYIAISQDYKEY